MASGLMAILSARLENTAAETVRGIAIFVAGSTVMPLFDAMAKLVVTEHAVSPGEMATIRLFLQAMILLPILLAMEGSAALAIRHPILNLLRGALLGIGGIAFFSALRFIPLADATAIFFVEPMIVTVLSAIFLKETIGWRRVVAVLVGFSGALIVIRPNFAAFGATALLPMVAAFTLAAYLVLSRRLSRTASPVAMLFYSGVGGALFSGAALVIGHPLGVADLSLSWPTGPDVWLLILGASLLGTVGHLAFVVAYKLAPASVLAPFGYVEIVTAIIFGLLIFGDFPDGPKGLGTAIIVGSGIFIYLRERRLALRVQRAPVEH